MSVIFLHSLARAVLFSTAGAWGASPPLTFEACVRAAADANPQLRSAAHVLRAGEHAEQGAKAPFLPSLSASTTVQRSGTRPAEGTETQSTGYAATLTASQNLFAGGADRAKLDQAKANRAASAALLDTTRSSVSFDLKSAFAGLTYAQNYIALTAQILERRKLNARLILLRFEGGRENRGSVLLSQTHADQAKIDSLQASNALSVSQGELARLLARELSDDLGVTGEVPKTVPPASADVEQLAVRTPSYREAVAKERFAEAAVSLSRAGFLPKLNVTGSYGNTGPDFFPRQSNGWSVGAELVFPLFSGGADFHGLKTASELLKAAVLNREDTLRQVKVKLRQALAGFIEADRKLGVNRAYVEALSVRSKIAREKYNLGLLTFEDWDVIENDYIQRQKDLLASQRDRIVAEAAWEKAQGKGVFQ